MAVSRQALPEALKGIVYFIIWTPGRTPKCIRNFRDVSADCELLGVKVQFASVWLVSVGPIDFCYCGHR